MDKNLLKKTSKFFSYILRHNPDKIGIKLDENGWVDIDEFIKASNRNGQNIDRTLLNEVVETNEKKRFAISDDGLRIRASQGHSVTVDLNLKAVEPPDFLYHGTVEKSLDSIFSQGLSKMNRHHVHLSLDIETATQVGGRRGKPVILKVCSGDMHKNGFEFFCSDNNVWLVDSVPVNYIID